MKKEEDSVLDDNHAIMRAVRPVNPPCGKQDDPPPPTPRVRFFYATMSMDVLLNPTLTPSKSVRTGPFTLRVFPTVPSKVKSPDVSSNLSHKDG
jgi:hypothetical protein